MKLVFFFILLFVGANCSGLSPIAEKEIRESDQFCQLNNKLLERLQTSVEQLSASVTKNMEYINDLSKQSSSNSEMFALKFALKLDEMQKNLTEQIDQKLVSISEDLKKAFVDQLSEETNETSSILSDTQETEKILDQKISEDHKEAIPNLSDCKDVFNLGEKVSTSYLLPKYNRKVLCDLTTDGGGWLVIQKRQKVTNQVNFNRNWDSYKEGFGDLDTEFWIGNKFLHNITSQKLYELRIDMQDFVKGHFYATYSEFRVGNEESGYQLHIEGYEGNVTDRFGYHNNMKFTTFDRDNDNDSSRNCAKEFPSGFWYNDCYNAHLNGMFPTVPDRSNDQLIRWYNKQWLTLINVEMKIRPKQ